MAYTDHKGYKREHSNAVHRHRAYHHIYLKDRKKYPLPFEAYEVHHIDGNKTNNRMDNLEVLTPAEHDKAHEKMDAQKECIFFNGVTEKRLDNLYKKAEECGIKSKQVDDDFIERKKKKLEEVDMNADYDEDVWIDENLFNIFARFLKIRDIDIWEWYEEIWEELLNDYKERSEVEQKQAEHLQRKKERMDKIKGKLKGFFVRKK